MGDSHTSSQKSPRVRRKSLSTRDGMASGADRYVLTKKSPSESRLTRSHKGGRLACRSSARSTLLSALGRSNMTEAVRIKNKTRLSSKVPHELQPSSSTTRRYLKSLLTRLYPRQSRKQANNGCTWTIFPRVFYDASFCDCASSISEGSPRAAGHVTCEIWSPYS